MLLHNKMELLMYTCKLYEVENQCIETQSFGSQMLKELQENNVYDNTMGKSKYEAKVKGKKMRYREDPDDATSNDEILRQR